MRIVYCIAGFYRPAGMERVLADKAGWLAAHGHEVTILTTEQKGRPYAFPLDERITLRDLAIGYEDNNGGSLWNKIIHYPGKQMRHWRLLKAAVEEIHPEIVVSMFCNEVNLVPSLKDGSRKVLEVHFSRFKRLQYSRKGLWALTDRIRSAQEAKWVRRYDRFIVLTEEDRSNWPRLDTLRVIPNPVHFTPDSPVALDTKMVISVGRYTYQKGLDRLIDAWGTISRHCPEWMLCLVGDGEDRAALDAQIQRLGLQDRVILGSFEGDMAAVYSKASILALASRYEGLPMALIESQAFGVPSVAFDCQCGPREIIADGKTGILVKEGDIPALARALLTLIQDDGLRRQMGKNAFQGASRWNIDHIMAEWTHLFDEIL